MGLPYGKNWRIPETDIDKMLARASAQKDALAETKEYAEKSVVATLRDFADTEVVDGVAVHCVGQKDDLALRLEHRYPVGGDGYCCCPSGTRARALRRKLDELVCGVGDACYCKHDRRVMWEGRLAAGRAVEVHGQRFTTLDDLATYAAGFRASEKKARQAA